MSEYTVRDWPINSSTQGSPLSLDYYHYEIKGLKQQVEQFQIYIAKLEKQFNEKNEKLLIRLQQEQDLNIQLKRELMLYERGKYNKINKIDYSDQLNTLLKELDQLTQLIQLKSEKIISLESINNQLQNHIDTLECQMIHLEQQLQMQCNSYDGLKQEKNDLIIKLNDSSIAIQKLSVELQCKASQLLENNKQHNLQEQIREEITKAQQSHQEQFIRLLQQEICDLKEQLKNK